MREQPAGWYRDPVRPNLHRYWSGESWSSWVGEELLGGPVGTDEEYDDSRACG